MNLEELINLICKKSPFQKKKLGRLLERVDQLYIDQANAFLGDYFAYLDHESINVDEAIDAYLMMCSDYVRSQIHFMKTGCYPISDQGKAYDDIYDNPEKMKPYMVGLALSQVLWENHFNMFQHYKNSLNAINAKSCLEIGPGHGLFLKEAISNFGNSATYKAVDISESSIGITRSILEFMCDPSINIDYSIGDMLEMSIEDRFDYIIMGEVLEHVENPEAFLAKFRALLNPGGMGFLSTCVDCPAIDHVYHFKSIEEIQQMITGSGLKIISECILPAEDLPMEEIIKKSITINYAAIVSES